MVDALNALLTDSTPGNIVERSLEIRTALHQIIGQWVEEIESGTTDKQEFEDVIYSAVGREESDDSEVQLRDELSTLQIQESFTMDIISKAAPLKPSEEAETTLQQTRAQIGIVQAKLGKLTDLRFLTARAVSDTLATASWSLPEEDASNNTLRAIQNGMQEVVQSINDHWGRASYANRKTVDPVSAEDATVPFSKWTTEEDAELVSIYRESPSLNVEEKTLMFNQRMAAKRMNEGLQKKRDRTSKSVQKRIGMLSEERYAA
jgi:hypothetical protein